MKTKFVKLLAVLLLSFNSVFATDEPYQVDKIKPELKEKANAVIRMHQTTFTVKSIGEATEKVRYAITILNERAKDQATLHIFYDKLTKVNYIQGTLYDAQGKLISKLKKSDIQDLSAVSQISLFDDNRIKVAKVNQTDFPYTIEYEYETTTKNLLFYPAWRPQDEEELAVENAVFEVVMPKQLGLRFKEVNISQKAAISAQADNNLYKWEVKDLKAIEVEPSGPSLASIFPVVYTAPTEFEVEGYKGNMSTWAGFGKFQNELNAGRDILPEPLKQQLQQLVAGEKDPVKKIKKVYEYLQANTRYVSIQLGIGGWQPFEAKTVAEKGYGDCKALSNYTKAMLKAVGVDSHYALIMAGRNTRETLADFPSALFNHVILCVPLQKDTIWLECTSQTEAIGYMGSFTGDRHALLITPEGGKLVNTINYKAKDNLQQRNIEVFIDEQGDATAEATTVYTGLQQDELSQIMYVYNPEDQKKWLYKNINIPSFEINKFAFTHHKDRIPAVTEKLSLTVRKCVSKSGTRLFLTPNLLSAWTNVPAKTENRKYEVVTRMSFEDTDTVTYHLPKGYGIEYQPETIRIESRFGSYTASMKEENGVVTYIRKMTMTKGKYPAATYNELVDFYKKVAKADKTQMVFVNKGS